MSSEFWKQFPPIPGFDCLKMKHDIQTWCEEIAPWRTFHHAA